MYITNRFIMRSIMALGFLFIVATAVHAQKDDAIGAFSPYSFYGVGDLARPGTSFNRAMGGIGTAVRTSRQINFLNPSALTAHDSLSFMIDFGFESQNNYLAYYAPGATDLSTSAFNSINIHHIVMSFPIAQKLTVGAGLFPYSSVGYKIQRHEERLDIINEMGNIYYTYQGEGGINQLAFSLGYAATKNLSVGVQGQYYFGNIDRFSNIYFTTNPYFSNVESGSSLKVGNFGVSLGAQYDYPVNKKKDVHLTVGATYQFATSLGGRYLDFAYVATGTLPDTVRYREDKSASISVPQTISVGVSIRKGDLWLVGVEYVNQNWKGDILNNSSSQHRFSVTPNHFFKLGGEWTPQRYDFRNYFNRCTYRAGLNYEKTYMKFDDYRINDIGASIGAGFPINRWNTSVNISAEIGRRGTTQNHLIRETYFKVTVNFSLYDIWFLKHQID